MVAARPPLKLELFARPQEPAAEETSSGWIVDVHVDGERVLQNLLLKDPLSSDQRSLCRWYLEQYVQRSPYSVDLAKDAEHLLKIYPEELLDQLRLKEVVTPYLQEILSARLLSIEICDVVHGSGGNENTVHQLFWETLEDSTLRSDSSWEIIVQRSIQPSHHPLSLPNRVQSWRQADGNSTTINILLVIARDVSRNPAIYNDVSPFLASSVLTEIQRKLKESGSTLQLHVEIARPGTFASFEEHLRRSEEVHGQGYFHIIHFDLHGKVRTWAGKSSKYGFLYFSNPKSDRTMAMPAHTVGKVLKRHNIPFVILNACESARANCGDDANIAKIFQTQGVCNVLAMSFKVSSSAVELFLYALYHGLLVDGSSFGASAAGARHALRLNCNRPARFGLQRKMFDSFVAVLYGCGRDSILVPPDQDMRGSPTKGITLSMIENSGVTFAPISGVLGRDFDVLRLEKLLLKGGMVYLHGLAGVGKTAFLRYASSIWQRTAFVDAAVTIDFAKETILSEQDFANAVLGQLLQVRGEHYRSRLWTVPSLSLQSHDSETIKLIIEDLLSTIKVIIVLDGLEIPFTPFHSSLVPGSLDAIETSEICQSIKSILLPTRVPNTGNGCYLICAARRADTEWLENLIGQFGTQCYELRGLDMPDAIELSQKLLCAGGENVELWEYEDSDWLEAVIDLLQGIPLALLEVLPVQRALNIPWRLFYSRLHSGLATSPADLNWMTSDDCCFAKEMRHLSSVLLKNDFMFLLLFSNYWHEAPPLVVLQRLFLACVNDTLEDSFQGQDNAEEFRAWATSLSGFAYDRGYLRTDRHRVIPWIHPLFTVYGRAFASEFMACTSREKIKLLVVNSIQYLSSLPSIQSSVCKDDPRTDIKPTVGNANLLTCINFCLLGQSVIPLEQWPLQLLMVSSFRIHSGIYASTGPLIAEKYYELLKSLYKHFRAPIADEHYCIFFSLLVFFFCISRSHHNNWSWERCYNMSQLGGNMILVLEQHYGAKMVPNVALSKGFLLITQFLSLFHLYHDEEAKSTWQTIKSLKYELFRQLGQEPLRSRHKDASQESMERCKIPTLTSAHTTDWTIMSHNITYPRSPTSGVGLFYRIFGGIVDYLQVHESELLATEKSGTSEEPKERSRRNIQLSEEFYQYIEGCDRAELEEASRCCPRNLQVTLLGKDDDRLQVLNALEDANDTGNYMHAFQHHQSLLLDAVEGFLFDEADEHIKALRRICRKSSLLAPALPSFAKLEDSIQKKRSEYMLICSLFPSEAGGRQDALQIAEKLRNSLAEAPEQVSLAGRYCDRIRKERGSGAYPTHIPRELVVKVIRKYGKRSQDTSWVMNVNDTLETFARLLSETHDAIKARDFDTSLQKLDCIEELVEKEELLRDLITEPSPIKGIREACERGSAIRKLIYAWYAAISKDDFEAARSYVEDLTQHQRLAMSDWLCADDVAKMRLVTEREHLQYFMLILQQSEAAKDLVKYSKLYTEIVKRWEEGAFPSVDQGQMRSFRSANLEWMIQQTVDAGLWKDGIRFCDEYLMVSAWELKENPRAHDMCLNTRERCESELIQQSLNIAETNFDFDTCLQLIDD